MKVELGEKEHPAARYGAATLSSSKTWRTTAINDGETGLYLRLKGPSQMHERAGRVYI